MWEFLFIVGLDHRKFDYDAVETKSAIPIASAAEYRASTYQHILRLHFLWHNIYSEYLRADWVEPIRLFGCN